MGEKIEISKEMRKFLKEYEYAEELVRKAYYEVSVKDFESITHDPQAILKSVRVSAEEKRAKALQALGWLVARTMQGKM